MPRRGCSRGRVQRWPTTKGDTPGYGKAGMDSYKIHILGAAGAGTTTLGKALAERLNIAYFDSDFY